MGHQEDIFLNMGEGDQWHARNKDKPKVDPVFDATEMLGIKPHYVTEVGCGTGWRLNKYVQKHRALCCGIDPSSQAIQEGLETFTPKPAASKSVRVPLWMNLYVGTASDGVGKAFPSNLLIFGFCLYLCDPEDLPKIVYEADNNLIDGGYLVIHDFDPEYPHKVPYHHVEGLFSYKMNYAKLWLANPAYSLVRKNAFDDGTAVWVLKKDITAGWPEQENSNG